MIDLNDKFLEDKELRALFKLADEVGNKHYHRLTPQDFQDYLQYNHWRYINIEKSDLNWFEYEQYIFSNYSHRYPQVKSACPVKMLRSLKTLN